MKFEKLSTEMVFRTQTYKVTKENIYKFALEFDPQFMHVDEHKAKKTIFNSIIASGLHTLSISWKLWVELDLIGEDVIGGVGMENVKFIAPVFPEDELRVEVQIIEKREHPKKHDRGYFTIVLKTYNQNSKLVLTMEVLGLVKRNTTLVN
ncbi:MaoC/PaaZ C-terminal domain-containing protein [Alkalihalobacterium alkalinitrilicum]|uniref:MaoC/PaaZ C-terminal domain-containing protein n=1 Tax=Alkalihalobacterium alkalinitrilicum TaxID=427920 RepID=UPI000995B3F0|nr:MaoC/PaaZ C-terminal domain-containing protein [Alkalihalobacterium alkalinitrilicum]